MKKISDYIGEELILIQPSLFKREFEFRSSNELIAKMSFPKFFKTKAIVEGFAEQYEIKEPNFWRSDVEIFKLGNDMPFAKYKSTNFWKTKGIIELPRGEQLYLKFGVFKKSCEIYHSNELLLLFHNKFSFRDKNIITIEQKSHLIDENPWVIMLAWYKILQQNRKTSAVAS
jgi:hypothetical protein